MGRLRFEGALALAIFGLATIATFLLAFPLQLLALPWDPDRRVAAMCTRWTWGVLHFAAQPFWKVRITGRERLAGRAAILVANHQSVLDIPLLHLLPVPLRVTARPGVFAMPVYGTMARFGGHLEIAEESDIPALVTRVRYLLDRGIFVVVFPEGSRSDGRSLGRFHRGAFELALRCEADVLPVCIRGTGDAVPRGSAWARALGPRFHLQVLPRIPAAGATRRALAAQTVAVLSAAFHGPDPFAVASGIHARYLPTGKFYAGFARGKTTMDPAFWAAWERLPREGLVLDVGCGEGLLGAFLRECGSGVELWGVDIDPARLGRAQATAAPGWSFRVGDVRTVALPSGAAAVVCLDVLHYLSPPEQEALLTKMVAALRPGGVLLVRDPEPGRGLASVWTAMTERIFVAVGRHRGDRVVVAGGAWIAGRLVARMDRVTVEDASAGWFANVLVSGVARGATATESVGHTVDGPSAPVPE